MLTDEQGFQKRLAIKRMPWENIRRLRGVLQEVSVARLKRREVPCHQACGMAFLRRAPVVAFFSRIICEEQDRGTRGTRGRPMPLWDGLVAMMLFALEIIGLDVVSFRRERSLLPCPSIL